jgi:hypothetical protein
MISYHADPSGYPVYKWFCAEVFTLSQVGDFVTKLWSNMAWVGGCRSEENFSCAMWCALDFDEGPTKADVISMMREAGLAYILAPTKSDGVAKAKTATSKEKPACERFRVVLPFEDTIADLDVYRYNMTLLTQRFRADLQPVDGARCWQPSKFVEVAQLTGKAIPVNYEVPENETVAFKQAAVVERIKHRAAHRTFPRYVKEFLQGHINHGHRNKELFRCTCALLHFGYDIRKIRDLVSHIPTMQDHAGTEDTFKSACKRVGVDYE